jgi:hypothetical protein
MKKLIIPSIIIILLVVTLYSIRAQQGNKNLDQTFNWRNGDWAAYNILQLCKVLAENTRAKKRNPAGSATIFARYDRKEDIIQVNIYGNNNNVNDAKGGIKFWKQVIDAEIALMYLEYSIKFSENDVKFFYINRKSDLTILSWENGKYIVPE